MEKQRPLFDASAGEAARDEAIDRVGRSVDPEWYACVLDAIEHVAARGRDFTTDDVWEVLAEREVNRPRERRAMGAAMNRMKHAGVIVATDRMVPTARPEGHRNPKRVWTPAGRVIER